MVVGTTPSKEMTMLRRIAAACLVFSLVCSTYLVGQDLSAGTFHQLRTLILPTEAESGWSKIPWMSDFYKARVRAAEEGKPLFVWSMAAEPLGFC